MQKYNHLYKLTKLMNKYLIRLVLNRRHGQKYVTAIIIIIFTNYKCLPIKQV